MESARGEEGSKPPSAHHGGVVLLGIASTFSTAWVRKQNRRYMRLFRFGLAWWMHAGERAGGDAGVWVDAARLVTAAAYARTAFCSRQNSAGICGCLHAKSASNNASNNLRENRRMRAAVGHALATRMPRSGGAARGSGRTAAALRGAGRPGSVAFGGHLFWPGIHA